ncbi:RNA polymerase sigma factor [Povalibacter sp.]|uniref:RNA polymerase sigma factor n=1 Tax=Povalibacter sp. TaxID=1962978 RepID=UPI002D1FBE1F|nr:RNA polymerase sigma factor [Povalibacter sp.]
MMHPRSRDPRGRLEDAPEEHVVALAMSGDDGAFNELVQRRQKRVRDMLRRLCDNHSLADDLAQQTFVQAWRGIRALRDPGAFGGWLKRVAVNVWLAETRRVLAPIDDDEGAFLAVADPAPSPERRAGGIDLERALARLGPGERLCVVLAHGEGMTHAEIAEATGLPLGTVKSHVLRGSDKLKQLYAGVNRDA